MKSFIASALLAVALFPANARGEQAKTQALPNILFVTIDTLRADHMSSYGYHIRTSPNMDRLADEGVRFDRAYTVTTRTAPSHFSMLTSRYPQEHGAKLNGFAMSQDTQFLTLPQFYRKLGYTTGGFVSAWPLTARLTHLDRWFDSWDQDLDRQYQMINSSRWAEDVTPKAASWLHRHKEDPFFLWVHYFDPHSPYQFREDFPPTEKSGKTNRLVNEDTSGREELLRDYDSEILYVDHHVQKLLDVVDELDLRDNTLVVLVSDHGEALDEIDGYRGHSRRTYESILHVPLILRLPGVIPAGTVIPEPVSLLDLAPTLVDLTIRHARPDAETPTTFAGRSLAAAVVDGAEFTPRPVRFVAYSGQKWHFPKWLARLWLGSLDFPLRMGTTVGNRKVVWIPGDKELKVRDLAEDPLELHSEEFGRRDKIYKQETERMEKWYEATTVEDGETEMTEEDRKALETLGYIN